MKASSRATRIIAILALAAALLLPAGCGQTAGDGGDLVFGRGILYARAATDQEAFPEAGQWSGQASQQMILDQQVPLAGLPDVENLEAAGPEEGWLLVRYAQAEEGAVEPLWVGVWSEGQGWLEAALDCQRLGLRLLAGE